MDNQPDFFPPKADPPMAGNNSSVPIPPHKSWSHWLVVAVAIVAVVVYFITSYYYALWPFESLFPPLPSMGPAVTLGPAPTPSSDTSTWQTYSDDLDKFEIKYPPDWFTGVTPSKGEAIYEVRNFSQYQEGGTIQSGGMVVSWKFGCDSGLDTNGYHINDFGSYQEIEKSFCKNRFQFFLTLNKQPTFQDESLLEAIVNSFTVSAVDTSTWKTYTNIEYGFEFKYPGDTMLQSRNAGDTRGIIEIANDFTLSYYPNYLNNETLEQYLDPQRERAPGDIIATNQNFKPYKNWFISYDNNTDIIFSRNSDVINISGSDINLLDQILSTFKFIGKGFIEGSLGYPSDFIPPWMIICAENVADKSLYYCTKEHISDSKYQYGEGYKLEVPQGDYYVFATLDDQHSYKAYYSELVTCGIKVECQSHKPILVKVVAGKTISKIDPQDWYK